MSAPDSSLRLRPWVAFLLFISAYAPLLLILIIKDYDPDQFSLLPRHPTVCALTLLLAVGSCIGILLAVREVRGGLVVEVTKAANKSGEMFGYTIPYMVSFLRIDMGDWQTLASLAIFLGMMFAVAYRTQTVFVNPVLALAGYMLIDCTFKRDSVERQAMVVTRVPIAIGESYTFERLSYYLYVAANVDDSKKTGGDT